MIGADGNQFGIVSINEALEHAQEAGLELVEISPNAKPPVCKILDYGKFKYEEQKRQQITSIKLIRILKRLTTS